MGIIDKIEEIQKKADNYDRILEEYNKLKETINITIKALSDLSLTKGLKKDKTFNVIYEKMKLEDNFQVTVKKLQSMGIEKLKSYAIIAKLKKLPNIEAVKDGKTLRLFYRNKEKINTEDKEIKFSKTSFMG